MYKYLITTLSLFIFNFAYSQTPPTPPGGGPWTPGAQATPINEYTIVLIVAGIVIASGLYFYKNKYQVKTK